MTYFEISVLDTSFIEDINFYIRGQQKDVTLVQVYTEMLTVRIICGSEVVTANSDDDIKLPI